MCTQEWCAYPGSGWSLACLTGLWTGLVALDHNSPRTVTVSRVIFAQTILGRIEANEDYLSIICFSDEATFHIFGHVQAHNMQVFGKENPRAFVEYIPQSPKINV